MFAARANGESSNERERVNASLHGILRVLRERLCASLRTSAGGGQSVRPDKNTCARERRTNAPHLSWVCCLTS